MVIVYSIVFQILPKLLKLLFLQNISQVQIFKTESLVFKQITTLNRFIFLLN